MSGGKKKCGDGGFFLFVCLLLFFFFLVATYMVPSLIKIFLLCHNAFQSYVSSTVTEIDKLPAPNKEANQGAMDPKSNFRKVI